MSSTFTLYVVDERVLPGGSSGMSDRQRYDALVAAVRAKGARWASLELDVSEFADALELIDDQMGGTDFLPVFAFNNSPHNLLGNHGDCPCFGYFNPEQAGDLNDCLQGVSSEIDAYVEESDDETTESVFQAFQSTAKEAARRGYAVAVLHDE
ncbi:hypothetical protein WME94_51415 [Sorangium sp. So ce429]